MLNSFAPKFTPSAFCMIDVLTIISITVAYNIIMIRSFIKREGVKKGTKWVQKGQTSHKMSLVGPMGAPPLPPHGQPDRKISSFLTPSM